MTKETDEQTMWERFIHLPETYDPPKTKGCYEGTSTFCGLRAERRLEFR